MNEEESNGKQLHTTMIILKVASLCALYTVNLTSSAGNK